MVRSAVYLFLLGYDLSIDILKKDKFGCDLDFIFKVIFRIDF